MAGGRVTLKEKKECLTHLRNDIKRKLKAKRKRKSDTTKKGEREEEMMTIEMSLLLSGISVAFAVFFGISTKSRNTKKDTQEEAATDATLIAKLEGIQTSMIEVKTDIRSYREEMRAMRDKVVSNEASLKSLHKRVDKVEEQLQSIQKH